VGSGSESVGGGDSTGAVNVIYGSATGLTATGDQFWSRGIKGDVSFTQGFGESLAAGNFGKSGRGDLAIGAPQVTLGNNEVAGEVHVLYGTARGLNAAGDQLWSLDTPGILGGSRESSYFGEVLVASP